MARRPSPWLFALCLWGSFACRSSEVDHVQAAQKALYERSPREALRHYRLALDALEKNGSAEARVLRARALRGAADTYYLELRDMPNAVAVYRELIACCPEAPESLEGRVRLAEVLQNHFRDYRGAITELTAALARNPPQGAELSHQVAKLYFELGDYQQADLEAQALLRRYETSAQVDDTLFLRGQALAMIEGRRPEAMRSYQELAHRFPDSPLAPYALYELARLRLDSGELEQAIETWVAALERHPDPALVQNAIVLARKRIHETVPDEVGVRAKAFDQPQHPPKPPAIPAKTSVEAAGGSAEEAASEAKGEGR